MLDWKDTKILTEKKGEEASLQVCTHRFITARMRPDGETLALTIASGETSFEGGHDTRLDLRVESYEQGRELSEMLVRAMVLQLEHEMQEKLKVHKGHLDYTERRSAQIAAVLGY